MSILSKIVMPVLLMLALSFSGAGQANITRVEYYLDADPGYGLAQAVPISASPNITASFNISTVSISQGMHIVGVRSRDAGGLWSLDEQWLLFKSAATVAPVNITRAEWYIDTDPGYGNATAIATLVPGIDIASLSFSANLSSISNGMHIIGIRSRDAYGAWSLDEQWLLFKSAAPVAPVNITRAEWYIDTDPGYGNASAITPLAPGTDIANLSFQANLTGITNGMHTIGVRSRDANGAWSLDEQWLLFKAAPPVAPANITKAEWYIDNDPGYGNATTITSLAPGTDIADLSFQADLTAIANGMHIIGVRSKDSLGAWSLDEQWLLFKSAPPVTAPNLRRIEYYIDNDPGYGQGFPLAFNPATEISPLLSFINATGLDSGSHKFMVRSQDINGAWSFDDSLVFIVSSSHPAPLININSVAFTNACAAGPFSVGYHATGTFNPGNQFIAELSDAAGSFANPTQLASPLSSLTPGGIINCIMPPGIQQGTGYRMRVRSTNPALTSAENTLSISVDKLFLRNDTVLVLLCAERGFNLTKVYNTQNVDLIWSVDTPSIAPVGIHTLFATNAIGCRDTAQLNVIQKIADWTGAVSSDWHNPANWSTGTVPDSTTHVRVGVNSAPANPCVISSNNAEVLSIHAANGFLVQVNNTRKIIIRGDCIPTRLP